MNKWYIRRDFSVAAERLGRRGQFLSSDAPPPDALFWEMWQECEPIARQVLETAYFKGILNNDLDPNAYGALMVQDAYYCFKAQDAYAAAATHPWTMLAVTSCKASTPVMRNTMPIITKRGTCVKPQA